MATQRILIHIGYHKTATTWMQTKLFTHTHHYHQLMNHQEVHDLIVGPHGLVFDPAPARELIEQRLAKLRPSEVPVISSEILSGLPFLGARESDCFAHRLKQIAPDALILASIRAQLKILPSVYMQYLLRSGTMPPEQFFTERESVGHHRFNPVHFEYDRLIGLYQQLFGEENIFVLQQERLRKGADLAAKELAMFCGNGSFVGLSPDAAAPHPPSYPEYAAPFLRRVNHFQRGAMHHNPVISLGNEMQGAYRVVGRIMRMGLIKRMLSERRPVSSFVESHFASRFDESNARLAKICHNPLDMRGY